jgi:hypothetical protein
MRRRPTSVLCKMGSDCLGIPSKLKRRTGRQLSYRKVLQRKLLCPTCYMFYCNTCKPAHSRNCACTASTEAERLACLGRAYKALEDNLKSLEASPQTAGNEQRVARYFFFRDVCCRCLFFLTTWFLFFRPKRSRRRSETGSGDRSRFSVNART